MTTLCHLPLIGFQVTGQYSGQGHSSFLPFTARLYVAAGGSAVRLVHFFIFDGDQNNDFIKGLVSHPLSLLPPRSSAWSHQGLAFDTPLSDELFDRHIRFSTTDGGVWAEPVRVLSGLRRDATVAVLDPQFAGTPVPDISTWPTGVSQFVDDLPLWGDVTLDQLSSERFSIAKRPVFPTHLQATGADGLGV